MRAGLTVKATFCPHASKHDHTLVWPAEVPFPAPVAADGDVHFEIETVGMWHIVSKIRGVALEKLETGANVYGARSLLSPRESGHVHEGRVSVDGKTHRAFTSSQLFLVEGKLVNVGILYVCRRPSS